MSDLTFGMRLTYDGKTATADMKDTRASMEGVVAASNKMASQYSSAAMSAKQLAQANRQLPMQFTDIVTSLAAGQPPMMVMLQQGGQLKDTYGGVGNAAKAMAGYIVGLANPVTLVAAAVAAGGYAWYQWGESAKEAAEKAAGELTKANEAADKSKHKTAQEQIQDKQWRIESLKGEIAYTDTLIQKQIALRLADRANGARYVDEELRLSKLRSAKNREIENEIRNIEDLKKAQKSDQWESLTATNSEKKDAELKNLKQLYDEQLVLHRNNKQELLKDEQEYQNGIAQIDSKYVKKVAAASGMQVLISLERAYQNELEKRREALNAPLLSASARALEEDLRMVSKRAQDARVELENQKASQGISLANYNARLEEVNATEVEQEQAIRNMRAEQDQLNASWEYGAAVSLRKYQDEIDNTAATSERFFTSTLKNMETQEVAFIRKGKADWKSLGDSIINELLRIQVAKMNAGFAGSLSSFFGIGSGFGGEDLTATNMGGSSYSGIVDGIIASGGSYEGGGFTGKGSRSGGIDGRGGFLSILHPQETVVDHASPRSDVGAGVTVLQPTTISIDARGADAGIEQRIRSMMPAYLAENQRLIVASVQKAAAAKGRSVF